MRIFLLSLFNNCIVSHVFSPFDCRILIILSGVYLLSLYVLVELLLINNVSTDILIMLIVFFPELCFFCVFFCFDFLINKCIVSHLLGHNFHVYEYIFTISMPVLLFYRFNPNFLNRCECLSVPSILISMCICQ